MKKVLLLMAMLTIGLASINAQDNLRWGATVGMNSSNFSITGFDSKIGFHAGVKAEVGLLKFQKESTSIWVHYLR